MLWRWSHQTFWGNEAAQWCGGGGVMMKITISHVTRLFQDLDSYLKTRSPITFLSDLKSNLQVGASHASMLYIRMQVMLVISLNSKHQLLPPSPAINLCHSYTIPAFLHIKKNIYIYWRERSHLCVFHVTSCLLLSIFYLPVLILFKQGNSILQLSQDFVWGNIFGLVI